MKILITGKNGQLAQALLEILDKNKSYSVVGLSKDEFNIVNYSNNIFEEISPDLVINSAAYTSVDEAELMEEKAFQINQIGVKNLAKSCENMGIPIIHFSTDYVFDGSKNDFWNEDDETNPINIYGKSKLAGEKEIIKYCSKYLIFRTSWVFSDTSKNFVTSILNMAQKESNLKIISDQWGNPTCVYEIARIISEILPKIKDKWGIYNLAQGPATNWYEFSKIIIDYAKSKNLVNKKVKIKKINSCDYNTNAIRPQNSKLSTQKLVKEFEIKINSWESSLLEVFKRIIQKNV